ncbi:MAG: transposase [Lachnospiraceae bacterium]|nr:transposase [Lachnospiraceae bacterium]
MGRRKREWYPGAIYHLMARGNRHQKIYGDRADFEYFLVLMEEVKKRYSYEVHSYCLMTNHFHLLLETKDIEIWRIMKWLMQVYAQYYNIKYGFDGHLFQGRYRSCLVEDDAYFLQTSRYIHLNPVKAKMVDHPEDYEWSSYQALIGMRDRPCVTLERIWSYFKKPQGQAYRIFVDETPEGAEAYEKSIQTSMKEDDEWLPW